MVHALSEIRRVLVPDGFMIDLRPLSGRSPIEIVSARASLVAGHLQDLEDCIRDDVTANQRMTQAEQQGWFLRQAEDFFPFVYSWDTPGEMEDWVENEWQDYTQLDNESKQATRSAWASADADARVQIRLQMLITRWRVMKE
jgi:hypothetical protein